MTGIRVAVPPYQVESLQRKFASIHLTLAQQQEQAAGAKPGTMQVHTHQGGATPVDVCCSNVAPSAATTVMQCMCHLCKVLLQPTGPPPEPLRMSALNRIRTPEALTTPPSKVHSR